MDKAADSKPAATSLKKAARRQAPLDRISREHILAAVPTSSRFKGYKSCYVHELLLQAELVHCWRECWLTPAGKTILAPLPAGIMGDYGSNLRRFCLTLHA